MKYTANCVYCGKPATIFSGHVLSGQKKIIAGWCKKHGSMEKLPHGFRGHYIKSFGIRKNDS